MDKAKIADAVVSHSILVCENLALFGVATPGRPRIFTRYLRLCGQMGAGLASFVSHLKVKTSKTPPSVRVGFPLVIWIVALIGKSSCKFPNYHYPRESFSPLGNNFWNPAEIIKFRPAKEFLKTVSNSIALSGSWPNHCSSTPSSDVSLAFHATPYFSDNKN